MDDSNFTFADWISVLVLLSLVFVVGTVGNVLVLGVYLQHIFCPHAQQRQRQMYRAELYSNGTNMEFRTQSGISMQSSEEQLFSRKLGTPTFFILVLAFVDLIVCAFVVPISLYLEIVEMRPNAGFWCKAQAFLSVCNIMFSSLLVIAIALDRYFAICHPLHHIMTMHRAKIMTVALGIFCILFGLLGTATIKFESLDNSPPECVDINLLQNTTLTEKYFYIAMQKMNTACFVLAILFVLVLYSLILRVVIQAQRRIRIFNREGLERDFKRGLHMSSIQTEQSDLISTLPNENVGNTDEPLKPKKPSKIRLSIRCLTESSMWREIRSASVLFVVAVVYIIVFTPSLLTANQFVPTTLVGYNIYYLNNVSNPLIYCFMSKAFRKKLKLLLCGGCLQIHTIQEDSILQDTQRRYRQRRLKSNNLTETEIVLEPKV
ncbi:uncharacterized protein DEA37_0010151 [Paragonimus westermani]|uniref:G-protein coupled receptors family 1 profile domain-containing protein n=1 Tax=Paragonimus westermani TaxID=34504 RepID=A0A5J4NMC3_9TREM|nr:uncharacterized protein DEA37_0010151 [Paragonimus westermani]